MVAWRAAAWCLGAVALGVLAAHTADADADYWVAGPGDTHPSWPDAATQVRITNLLDANGTAQVYDAHDALLDAFAVPGHATVTSSLGRSFDDSAPSQVSADFTRRIHVTGQMAVQATWTPVPTLAMGGTRVLPAGLLGTSYLVPGAGGLWNLGPTMAPSGRAWASSSRLTIVATEDGTTVRTDWRWPVNEPRPHEVRLDRGEAWRLLGASDEIGIHVEADHPVAVFTDDRYDFGGHASNLVDQLLPFDGAQTAASDAPSATYVACVGERTLPQTFERLQIHFGLDDARLAVAQGRVVVTPAFPAEQQEWHARVPATLVSLPFTDAMAINSTMDRVVVADVPVEVLAIAAHTGVVPQQGESSLLAPMELGSPLHQLQLHWPGEVLVAAPTGSSRSTATRCPSNPSRGRPSAAPASWSAQAPTSSTRTAT